MGYIRDYCYMHETYPYLEPELLLHASEPGQIFPKYFIATCLKPARLGRKFTAMCMKSIHAWSLNFWIIATCMKSTQALKPDLLLHAWNVARLHSLDKIFPRILLLHAWNLPRCEAWILLQAVKLQALKIQAGKPLLLHLVLPNLPGVKPGS